MDPDGAPNLYQGCEWGVTGLGGHACEECMCSYYKREIWFGEEACGRHETRARSPISVPGILLESNLLLGIWYRTKVGNSQGTPDLAWFSQHIEVLLSGHTWLLLEK